MVIRCPNGLINFEKFWALSRLITQVLSYKNTNVSCPTVYINHWCDYCMLQYPQERVKTVLNYLMTVPVCTEDGKSSSLIPCDQTIFCDHASIVKCRDHNPDYTTQHYEVLGFIYQLIKHCVALFFFRALGNLDI